MSRCAEGQQGVGAEYGSLGKKEKSAFLENYVATLIQEGKLKSKSTTRQVLEIENVGVREGEWVSKATMIQRLGKEKAENKINSGKLKHQPDQDTGLDGEWDREYFLAVVKKVHLEKDKYYPGDQW